MAMLAQYRMKSVPCFEICRMTSDINPYTSEPEVYMEVIQQVMSPVDDKQLGSFQKQYNDPGIWVRESTIWM
ncbi:hypothetical protein fHeYen902_099c [Yersinia phage fHe-Yen9-02]|nr:hypothetical protein fHeYen902_099c [Yersinia phage fHe-Yen9-02]